MIISDFAKKAQSSNHPFFPSKVIISWAFGYQEISLNQDGNFHYQPKLTFSKIMKMAKFDRDGFQHSDQFLISPSDEGGPLFS